MHVWLGMQFQQLTLFNSSWKQVESNYLQVAWRTLQEFILLVCIYIIFIPVYRIGLKILSEEQVSMIINTIRLISHLLLEKICLLLTSYPFLNRNWL